MNAKELKDFNQKKEKKVEKITKEQIKIARCDHHKEGKKEKTTLLKPISEKNENLTRCSACKTKVDTTPMDIGELKKAIDLIFNAWQCIFMNRESTPETRDKKAEFQLNLESIPEWYENYYLDKLRESEEKYADYDDNYNGPQFVNSMNFRSGYLSPNAFNERKKHKDKDKKKKKKHKK